MVVRFLLNAVRQIVMDAATDLGDDVIVALEAAADRASEESGPVEAAMSREEQVVVSRALAQLPASLRQPLILP